VSHAGAVLDRVPRRSVRGFSIAGARRRGYDPRRHPVSALALGPGGAVQPLNFIVSLAGLLQRVSIVAGFGWLTALCLRA
jgi:hypothetical protein